MKYLIKGALLACALLVLPAVASAADGFATSNVNMRSGPSTRYPAVVVIPAGAPVNILGCLAETPWCDVAYGRIRGWVAGRYVQTVYRQNRVYVAPEYYEPLGIPTIEFDIDTYWDRNYRKRDFYRDRDRWRRDDRPRDVRRYDRRDDNVPLFERDRDRDRDNRRWERNIDRGSDDFNNNDDTRRDKRWRNNDDSGIIDTNRRDRNRDNDNDNNRVDNAVRDQQRQLERQERRKQFQDENGNWKGFDQDGPRTLRCKPGMEGCS